MSLENMTTPSFDWLISNDQNVIINMSGVLYIKAVKTESGKVLIKAQMKGITESVTIKVLDDMDSAINFLKEISKVMVKAGNKIFNVK